MNERQSDIFRYISPRAMSCDAMIRAMTGVYQVAIRT